MKPIATTLYVFAFTLSAGSDLVAQEPAPTAQNEALLVFLDCQNFFCDFDHFRREITFVNWVRDRQDAQVHILGTAQGTGGGGTEFTFTFIGLRQFGRQSDTLRYVARNTDTQTERRDGQVRTVKLGLMRYVAGTAVAERIQIAYQAPTAQAPAGPVEDPWNLWVFTTRIIGNMFGEQRQRFLFLNGSITANRTAEDFKINVRLSGSYNRSEQELTAQTFVNTSKSYSANGLVVWSLSDHWSFGVQSSVNSSTFLNQDLALRGGPAIEYNIYPYAESTRRQLTVGYTVEPAYFNYEEETIFDQTAETLLAHRLDVGLQVQQPWGSVRTSVDAVQFLRDPSKHRVELSGGFSLRIVRGLDLSINGNVARVKDQLYLPKGGLTDEEILVRRRQLGTSFRYFTFFSLSYRFGSKFANVVNPRMSGGGGGGEVFFF